MTAVYDFEVASISFDAAAFLILSEIACQKGDFEGLHVVLALATGDGFHANVLYDLDQKQWRLKNIILPLCWMIPSIKKLTICTSRDDLKSVLDNVSGPIFPEKYSLDRPLTLTHGGWVSLAALRGAKVQYFEASEQAKEYARLWFKSHNPTNSKNVVITLREAPFNAHRNTDLSTWMNFCRYLRKAGYYPIIIRDIETALLPIEPDFKDLVFVSSAAFNLDLRLAFYEESFLHVTVSQGAATIGTFDNNVQFIHFLSRDAIEGEAIKWSGIRHGSGYPFLNKFQRLVWREQTLNNLIEEFERSAKYIMDETKQGRFAENLAPDPANTEPLIDVARRHFEVGEWLLFSAVAEFILQDEPENFELYYLIGLTELNKQKQGIGGDQKKAESALRKSLAIIHKLSSAGVLETEVAELEKELVRIIG